MVHKKIIEEDGIQILIGDFDDQNYSLEINDDSYFFTPNILKHLDLTEDSKSMNLFSKHIQPYIKVDLGKRQVTLSTDPLGTDFIYIASINGNFYIH